MAIELTDPSPAEGADIILSPEALSFVEQLHQRFRGQRDERLAARAARRAEVAATGRLDFLPETRGVRDGEWKVAPAPADLRNRRVEMTGPASPVKMAINALNSGAQVWLADLEDASAPTWHNVIDSQLNLYRAARGRLDYTSPEGKDYSLRQDVPLAVVVTRPRGWHLSEKNVLIDGEPAIGALVDFGLHFFANAKQLLNSGSGPYYYLPKLESHLEARLWNDIFVFAQDYVGVPQGSVRATVLIETIPAAFEMEEILFELRDHASGLNAGRWDYLFSIIKYFRDAGPSYLLPDRASISMTAPFMRAYTELLVKTCHRRGAFAMGGMAAVIPNRREPAVTEEAFAKVRADKSREADDGFDGSWVAHPDLVPVALEVFDAKLGDKPNQLDRQRDDVQVTGAQLLAAKETPGQVTEAGVRNNVSVGIQYLESWLRGGGAVAIFNLMEDAATAEISRSQIWQWVHNGASTAEGTPITPEFVRQVEDEELDKIKQAVGEDAFVKGKYDEARELFDQVALSDDFVEFLTLPAYERIA